MSAAMKHIVVRMARQMEEKCGDPDLARMLRREERRLYRQIRKAEASAQ